MNEQSSHSKSIPRAVGAAIVIAAITSSGYVAFVNYYESTWLGSTKRIKLKGRFVAKAGYDLTQPFSIDVSEDRQTIRAIMPPAQILSVELAGVDVLQDENGWWNKLSSEERQRGLNSLLAEARKSLGRTSLIAEAEASFLAQLEKAIRKNAPPAAKLIRQPLP